MDHVFIYALNDPNTGKTRYVGKANNPYTRYEKHMKECVRERSHKANWIRSLLKFGQAPILEVLDYIPEQEWKFWETEWIKVYKILGIPLTNGTDGGDGTSGASPSEETKKKMSVSHLGKTLPVAQKIKISSSLKGRIFSEEHKKNLSLSKMGNKYRLKK